MHVSFLRGALSIDSCRCRSGQSCFDAIPWDELSGIGVADQDVPLLTRDVLLTHLAENDTLWLSAQPGGTHYSGAMGSPDVPGWMSTNSTPAKYVELHSSLQASQALRFAAENNIALVVKSTGHDWNGRSMFHGSLLVWTHNMTSIEWHELHASGLCDLCGKCCDCRRWVQFYQLYRDAFVHDKFVVGCTCLTVGHVGCILGGCYGDASRMYGSGATNLLEAGVVLADGQVVTANACGDHADFFRALRGGGGAFGLVTTATYMTFAKPVYEAPGDARAGLNRFLSWYADVVQQGLAMHFGGIVFIYPDRATSLVSVIGLPLENCTRISQSMGVACNEYPVVWPLADAVHSPDVRGIVDAWELKSASSYRTESLTRYFKLNHISTDEGRQRFAETVAALAASLLGTDRIIISLNYGLGHGSAIALANVGDTLVHPDVATALGTVKLDLTTDYNRLSGDAASNAFPIDQTRYRSLVDIRSKLDTLLPEAGSYYNEGDYTDEHWQDRFWGSNSAELLRTKSKYDPDNVFTCHQCVGSEDRSTTCGRRLATSVPVPDPATSPNSGPILV